MKYQNLATLEQVLFHTVALSLFLFYLYSATISPVATQYHRGIYVLATYTLCFLIYRSPGKWFRGLDYLFILLATGSISYWIFNFEVINYRVGAENQIDRAISVIGVLLGLELSRRVLGMIFPIMGMIFLSYGVYGMHFPEIISHSGENFIDLCTNIFYKSDGLFGIMVNVLASYVILFVFFGSFLEKCGAQKFFMDLSLALLRHRVGGAAKVSVIASGFFGSISGSAIANTVSTGTFTIPIMKKSGFKPEVAGAIEPAASIGGMFMPPIMGAGGFIMAELTGIKYATIMLVSLFPALLYFFSVYVMVHYYAKKHQLKGIDHPSHVNQIFRTGWYYLLPLGTITLFMLLGYSPAFSAVIGIVTCLIIMIITQRKTIKVMDIVQASSNGFEQSIKIGATIGVIGIIIGVLSFSGLVLTFADIIIELADNSLFLTIVLIALASLVLGMGVPVSAAYLITAVIAVPSLIALGVNEIAAHFIVYWLSQDSNITPPVCIAAFAGATIAKANMWLTSIHALKFSKMLYIAPFFFAYLPGFSLIGSTLEIIQTFLLTTLITFVFSYLLSGYWLRYFKTTR